MSDEDNFKVSIKALTALRRVLVRTRTQAYHGADSQQIARILDDAEYLAAMISQQGDDADFRRHLVALEEKFAGFEGVVAGFDEATVRGKRELQYQRGSGG